MGHLIKCKTVLASLACLVVVGCASTAKADDLEVKKTWEEKFTGPITSACSAVFKDSRVTKDWYENYAPTALVNVEAMKVKADDLLREAKDEVKNNNEKFTKELKDKFIEHYRDAYYEFNNYKKGVDRGFKAKKPKSNCTSPTPLPPGKVYYCYQDSQAKFNEHMVKAANQIPSTSEAKNGGVFAVIFALIPTIYTKVRGGCRKTLKFEMRDSRQLLNETSIPDYRTLDLHSKE